MFKMFIKIIKIMKRKCSPLLFMVTFTGEPVQQNLYIPEPSSGKQLRH